MTSCTCYPEDLKLNKNELLVGLENPFGVYPELASSRRGQYIFHLLTKDRDFHASTKTHGYKTIDELFDEMYPLLCSAVTRNLRSNCEKCGEEK